MSLVGMARLTSEVSALAQLYQAPVVHFTNYGDAARDMSVADPTSGDVAWLGGRSLPALGPKDHAFVTAQEAPIHRDMIRYTNDLGVTNLHPNNIHAIPGSTVFAPLGDSNVNGTMLPVRALLQGGGIKIGSASIVPFYVSSGSHALGSALGLRSETQHNVVSFANDKGNLANAAEQFGFLSPPTRIPTSLADVERYFTELLQIASDAPDSFNQGVWIKLRRSSGAEGVVRFDSLQALKDWFENDNRGKNVFTAMQSTQPNEGVVLQLDVKSDSVPCVCFFVGDTPAQDKDIGSSAQAFSNGHYVGNNGMLSEADSERLSPIIQKVSNWLRSIGFRGICGIDVVMGANGQNWVIDINARWNASTSSLMLFHNLGRVNGMRGVQFFRHTGQVRVKPGVTVNELATHLDRQQAAFSPEFGGVVPINLMTAHRPLGDYAGGHATINATIFGPTPQAVDLFSNLAHMVP